MIEIGFLISILSASNFIHTPRNQIFHFQILKLHFHTEDTGRGGGRNYSSLFFPKPLRFFRHLPKDKILSPANLCPCCHIDAKSREAAKPG